MKTSLIFIILEVYENHDGNGNRNVAKQKV